MSSLMICCPQLSILAIFEKRVTDPRTDGPTDQRTDGPTDRRTDKASYRDAWTHLKRIKSARASSLVSTFEKTYMYHVLAYVY